MYVCRQTDIKINNPSSLNPRKKERKKERIQVRQINQSIIINALQYSSRHRTQTKPNQTKLNQVKSHQTILAKPTKSNSHKLKLKLSLKLTLTPKLTLKLTLTNCPQLPLPLPLLT